MPLTSAPVLAPVRESVRDERDGARDNAADAATRPMCADAARAAHPSQQLVQEGAGAGHSKMDEDALEYKCEANNGSTRAGRDAGCAAGDFHGDEAACPTSRQPVGLGEDKLNKDGAAMAGGNDDDDASLSGALAAATCGGGSVPPSGAAPACPIQQPVGLGAEELRASGVESCWRAGLKSHPSKHPAIATPA